MSIMLHQHVPNTRIHFHSLPFPMLIHKVSTSFKNIITENADFYEVEFLKRDLLDWRAKIDECRLDSDDIKDCKWYQVQLYVQSETYFTMHTHTTSHSKNRFSYHHSCYFSLTNPCP